MSACGVLVANPSKDVLKMSSEVKDPEFLAAEVEKNSDPEDSNTQENDKTKVPKKRIMYTKNELLDLRSVPASLKKPDCLSEEFFVRNGVWDPIAWHESALSRSASPIVEGRCVTFEHGKKIELLDDAIELAPHRRSFCQGCHVQSTSESESTEKGSTLLRRLKSGSNNESKGVSVEGKDRLTGRAASQRKNIEKAILKDRENKQVSDGGKAAKAMQDGKPTNENSRENQDKKRDSSKNTKSFVDRERNERQKNRFNEKENKQNIDRNWQGGDTRRKISNGGLPEWMTDGPISQTDTIELKGFDADIEEERKALVKDHKKPSYLPQERVRKSSKGSSRSSTPNENVKKQRKKSRNEERRHDNNNEVKDEKIPSEHMKRLSPSDKVFDENGLFDLMDYLPTQLFAEEFANEPTTSKSKFSSWFRSQSLSSSDHSRPNSGHLGFGPSPVAPLPYFTPIQPAPTTQTFERPIPVSPLMEIFPENKPQPIEKPKELKGRVTVNEIEQQLPKPIGSKPKKSENVKTNDQNAFDKLVFTMKAAGQLPEKPAPVVSGLPEHLLPKPPKRTSPSFEKLKRALSRSPSPVNSGRISPFSFMNRPVSPLIPTVPERLLSPDFFQQPQKPKPVAPSALFNSFETPNLASSGPGNHHGLAGQSEQRRFDNGYGKEATASKYQQTPPKLPTAFLPTSVIKKIHSNKQDHKERSDTMNSNESYLNLNIGNTVVNHPPGLQTQNQRNTEPSFNLIDHANTKKEAAQSKLLSSSSFENHLSEKVESLFSSNIPQKSAPTSPHAKPIDPEDTKMFHSAPVTPHNELSSSHGVQRSVEPSSAFSRPIDKFGMVKSNNANDVNNMQRQGSFNASTPHPSMLNDQRYNNDVRMKNYAPATQQRGPINQQQLTQEKHRMQLPNAQQRMQPQQQMIRPQQTSQFNQRARANQPNAPRLPVPMNQSSALNSNLNSRANIPAVTAAMAAQLVQQQLLQQAARAHALQAAQVIQQQQQQNLLRTQMQAVMAQAYAREQAAKAMMYNPRAVASNLQAVAQQMGLRAPHPSAQGKGLPTPMVNQVKENGKEEKQPEMNDGSAKTKESPLSKWFNVDAIKKTPPAPQLDPSTKSKVLTLEDLEKQQN